MTSFWMSFKSRKMHSSLMKKLTDVRRENKPIWWWRFLEKRLTIKLAFLATTKAVNYRPVIAFSNITILTTIVNVASIKRDINSQSYIYSVELLIVIFQLVITVIDALVLMH